MTVNQCDLMAGHARMRTAKPGQFAMRVIACWNRILQVGFLPRALGALETRLLEAARECTSHDVANTLCPPRKGPS